MKILAIDSSTPQSCSAALLENKNILSQAFLAIDSPRSDRILSLVDEVFSKSGSTLEAVDGFALATGPGSFTGLRISVSLLKGFVLSTEKPFIGINTLESLAALVESAPQQICAILDAKKKQVYAAFFKHENGRLTRLSEDCAVSPEAIAVSVPTAFIGNGVRTYGELLSANLGELYIGNPKTKEHSTAASVGLLAHERFESEKSFDLDSLKIHYIRKSEAEINYGS